MLTSMTTDPPSDSPGKADHPGDSLAPKVSNWAKAKGIVGVWFKKELKLIVAGVTAIIAAIGVISKQLELLGKVPTWVVLVLLPLLIAAIVLSWAYSRFEKFGFLIDRVLKRSTALPPIDQILQPKGATPYQVGEKLPQRTQETRKLYEKILANHFTILVGPVGSGKTSLLGAGLGSTANDKYDVQIFKSDKELQERLANLVDAHTESTLRKPLLICLDQFDALFTTITEKKQIAVMNTLVALIERQRASVVIAIRNDFHDLLGQLCDKADPQRKALDTQNTFWLGLLSPEQARLVLEEILEPILVLDRTRKYEVSEFIESVVDQLKAPDDLRKFDRSLVVSPLDIQIVIDMMVSIRAHFNTSALTENGKTQGLLSAYLDHNLNGIKLPDGISQHDALLILYQLITPSGTKRTRNEIEIAEDLEEKIPAAGIKKLLESLQRCKLLSYKPPNGFELVHDWLARIIKEKKEVSEREADLAKARGLVLRRRLAYSIGGVIIGSIATLVSWTIYSYTDGYQFRRIRLNAGIEQVASSAHNDVLAHWLILLAQSDEAWLVPEMKKILEPQRRCEALIALLNLLQESSDTDKIDQSKKEFVSIDSTPALSLSVKKRIAGSALREAFASLESMGDDSSAKNRRLRSLLMLAVFADANNDFEILSKISDRTIQMWRSSLPYSENFFDVFDQIQNDEVYTNIVIDFILKTGVSIKKAAVIVLAKSGTNEEIKDFLIGSIKDDFQIGMNTRRSFFDTKSVNYENIGIIREIPILVRYGKAKEVLEASVEVRLNGLIMAKILQTIASTLDDLGQPTEAEDFWKKALAKIETIYIRDEQLTGLAELATQLIKHKHTLLAEAASTQLQAIWKTESDVRHRTLGATLLAEIADLSQLKETGIENWKLALHLAEGIDLFENRAIQLLNIGQRAINVDRQVITTSAWLAAAESIAKIENDNLAELISSEFTAAFRRIKSKKLTPETANAALELIRSFRSEVVRAKLYMEFAKNCIENNPSEARKSVDSGIICIRSLVRHKDRDDLLKSSTETFIALSALEDALNLSHEIRKDSVRSQVWLAIAEALAKAGRLPESISLLEKSLNSYAEISSKTELSQIRNRTRNIVRYYRDALQLEKIIQLNNIIKNEEIRFEFIYGIIQGLNDLGRKSQFEQQLELAADIVMHFSNQATQSSSYAKLASGFSQIRAYRRARMLADLCAYPHDRLTGYTEILGNYALKKVSTKP